jgi:hypothetical protein
MDGLWSDEIVWRTRGIMGAKNPTERKEAPVIRTSGLLAEYSLGQTPTGEWFALGSVRSETAALSQPAWMLVGTGASAEDAIAGLHGQLVSEARRLRAA